MESEEFCYKYDQFMSLNLFVVPVEQESNPVNPRSSWNSSKWSSLYEGLFPDAILKFNCNS